MRTIPLILLMLLALAARSPEHDSFYVFNADWKPSKVDSAYYLLHVHYVNDTCWQWDYYNFLGPMLKSEQYSDKNGQELNGITRIYNGKGLLDSTATYKAAPSERLLLLLSNLYK